MRVARPCPSTTRAPDGDTLSLALIQAPGARSAGAGSARWSSTSADPATPAPRPCRSPSTTFPDAIRDRFDIVSFDPRGTGASRPIDCIDDHTTDLLVAEDPTPDDVAELERFYTGANTQVDFNAACIAEERHVARRRSGTRNVAPRRRPPPGCAGRATLNYLGYSYGTVLGAVYTQEFPDARAHDGARRRRRPLGVAGATSSAPTPPASSTRSTSSSTGARTGKAARSNPTATRRRARRRCATGSRTA